MNVTLVYKAVLSVDGVDDANERDAYWGGFLEWMERKSVDIRDKDTWISLFRSKLPPQVMDQSSKQREDDIKSGSSVRSPTLRSLGISVQLAKYDGAGCIHTPCRCHFQLFALLPRTHHTLLPSGRRVLLYPAHTCAYSPFKESAAAACLASCSFFFFFGHCHFK